TTMKKRSTFAVLIPFVFSQFAFASTVPEAEPTADTAEAEQQAYEAWARNFVDSLDMQTGQIQLPNSVATLNVPESFYYLSPADTERVLVEAWGNPSEGLIQGMLFPAHVTPLDPEAWGVTIDFDEDGYVSDDDAADMNYDDLLAQMQAETLEVNPDRVAAGYPAIELMGWAASPHYDAGRRQLYWAQELKFGDDPAHILNYNIRALGRRGVLVMNFIADM